MTEDLILLVLGTGVLAVGYKIWQTSLDAREARIASPRTRVRVPWCSSWTAPSPSPVFVCRAAPRAAGASCGRNLRLHQRRLRTRPGLHRACRPPARGRRAGGQPFVNGSLNIDLHTHSNCSDGSLTPADLVARAAAAGVEVLALTDHDTVAGLEEAEHSAVVHGVRLVPGVEISASWRRRPFTCWGCG